MPILQRQVRRRSLFWSLWGRHETVSNDVGAAFTKSDFFPLTLEVGSGAGGHLDYVRHSYNRYLMIDISDYRPNKTPLTLEPFVLANAKRLPLVNGSVDRFISPCLLHHVSNPFTALTQRRNAVRPGGSLTIFLPCDPGLLWRLGRLVRPRRKTIRHGGDYDFLMALSHRNHVGSLMAILETVFKHDKVRRTGLPVPALRSWTLSLALVYQIAKSSEPTTENI